MAADADGAPVLVEALHFREMTGEAVDKEECIGVLSRQAFESLYAGWLVWKIDSTEHCGILQLLSKPKNSRP